MDFQRIATIGEARQKSEVRIKFKLYLWSDITTHDHDTL